ncbi:MAG: AmmeMemoRadiSam system protein B [Armatimonadota bacterium]
MTAERIRKAVVAGQFYEGDKQALIQQIEECYTRDRGPGAFPKVNPDGPREIIGLMCPHAGYQFSGPCAAYAYKSLAADGIPEVVIIIGPSHRSPQPTIQTSGAWRTPLGDALIDEAVASSIASNLGSFYDDPGGFAGEHSLEVQLPFLQHLYSDDLRIVPLMMVGQAAGDARRVADAISEATADRDAVIVASSDMTHFTSPEVAREQDFTLIERIEDLDPDGLIQQRKVRDISMCGAGPTAAMLHVAKGWGASSAELLNYAHSGEVHPSASVVGYASVVVR